MGSAADVGESLIIAITVITTIIRNYVMATISLPLLFFPPPALSTCLFQNSARLCLLCPFVPRSKC